MADDHADKASTKTALDGMKTQLTGMKGDRTTKTETLAPLLEALLEETQAASGAARAAELELETEMEELLH